MMNPPTTITRFAPSPTGYLHLGHAYSAWVNFEQATAAGGKFLLRIEDIDATRCRPEFLAAIYEDLAWLGLTWEQPVLVQSQQMPRYAAALDALKERSLLYRCFRTRKDIGEEMHAPHSGPEHAFTGAPLPPAEEQQRLQEGAPYAWRLSMEAAEKYLGPRFATLQYLEETAGGIIAQPAEPRRFGDVVLGRKDSGTSYHLASVLDDAMQGVTHVIRGEELREAAGLHALLYALFDAKPPIYRHHAMLRNDAGERLSKRDGALSLRAMRQDGWLAEEVLKKASSS